MYIAVMLSRSDWHDYPRPPAVVSVGTVTHNGTPHTQRLSLTAKLTRQYSGACQLSCTIWGSQKRAVRAIVWIFGSNVLACGLLRHTHPVSYSQPVTMWFMLRILITCCCRGTQNHANSYDNCLGAWKKKRKNIIWAKDRFRYTWTTFGQKKV